MRQNNIAIKLCENIGLQSHRYNDSYIIYHILENYFSPTQIVRVNVYCMYLQLYFPAGLSANNFRLPLITVE